MVYQCFFDGGVVVVLLVFIDEDKEEEFYIVSWVIGRDGLVLLVCSGSNGVICIVDCESEKFQKSFVGYGDLVNEFCIQILKFCFIVLVSKDESIRLWNVDIGVCVFIFVGVGGYCNEVLSVDFYNFDIL